MTIEERLVEFDKLSLFHGAHNPNHTFCVMEAVAYVAGEEWTDSPQCVSPVIGAFLRVLNDSLDFDTRQQLKPYIPRVIGTNTDKKADEARAWLATDWLVRECAPAFLRCAGLTDHAETLEQLASLDSAVRTKSVQKDIVAARDAAGAAARDVAWDAAGAAARDAAWDAARAAAWDAAWAAAKAAAWDAAWAAARTAAWDAARTAAWDAARAAAWDAARDAAWDAARAAAWDAARDVARAAAGDAAWGALEPTVKLLQGSAFRLLDRMIEVGGA